MTHIPRLAAPILTAIFRIDASTHKALIFQDLLNMLNLHVFKYTSKVIYKNVDYENVVSIWIKYIVFFLDIGTS